MSGFEILLVVLVGVSLVAMLLAILFGLRQHPPQPPLNNDDETKPNEKRTEMDELAAGLTGLDPDESVADYLERMEDRSDSGDAVKRVLDLVKARQPYQGAPYAIWPSEILAAIESTGEHFTPPDTPPPTADVNTPYAETLQESLAALIGLRIREAILIDWPPTTRTRSAISLAEEIKRLAEVAVLLNQSGLNNLVPLAVKEKTDG